jgi:hypothetical protein
MLPPGSFGIPFIAKHRLCICTGQIANGVKLMDRHVCQKNVVHFLAKAAEMCRHEEIDVNGGQTSNQILDEQPFDSA